MRKSVWILPGLIILSACGFKEPVSPEDCVGRFKGTFPAMGAEFGKLRFEFTYRLPGSTKALDAAVFKRARITVTDGNANEETIKTFLSEEIYHGGQFLLADNIALYRVQGPEADWDTAIATACRGTPPGSSLYKIHAVPIREPSKPD